jgi:predicted RNA-binding Zn-ribbon protein involved in translation (DUF1610 family)
MALEVYPLINIIVILFFVFFLLIFAFMVLSFFRWLRTPAYYERLPAIKIEEYACPKCGSKELELVGRRTIRCRKCGTTFTIRTGITEEYWVFWPFFWFFPFIWWIPKKD